DEVVVKPVDPDQPTNPDHPINPTNPSNPMQPTNPKNPINTNNIINALTGIYGEADGNAIMVMFIIVVLFTCGVSIYLMISRKKRN
ncbi:MAG: hypothetical protein RR581_00375, partial [Eubacterium sp.]